MMEQLVIDLLQSVNHAIALKNLSTKRILYWRIDEWVVKDNRSKTILITQDLATALKWLKGEE